MCEYCNTDYKVLNKTREYSDIEISLYTAISGIRVRAVFDDKGLFGTQDVVRINYCPMCRQKVRKGRIIMLLKIRERCRFKRIRKVWI